MIGSYGTWRGPLEDPPWWPLESFRLGLVTRKTNHVIGFGILVTVASGRGGPEAEVSQPVIPSVMPTQGHPTKHSPANSA